MRHLARSLGELFLSGPVAFFYPFLAFSTGHTVYDLFARPQAIGAFSLMFVAGGVGLTGLYAAILLPTRFVRARPWLRWTLTGMMAMGIVLAVFFLALGGASSTGVEIDFWGAWLYGGPLLAALSALRRFFAATPSPPGASPSSGA